MCNIVLNYANVLIQMFQLYYNLQTIYRYIIALIPNRKNMLNNFAIKNIVRNFANNK